jgi:SPP1 family predicted phage head-tail adaptor
MTLAAGRLRHRVRIEQPVDTRDPDTGGVITTWQLVAEVWAAIEPLSTREFIQAAAVQSSITGRIVIRYRDGLASNLRVVHNGQVMNPAGWLPDKDSGLEYVTAPYALGDNLRD